MDFSRHSSNPFQISPDHDYDATMNLNETPSSYDPIAGYEEEAYDKKVHRVQALRQNNARPFRERQFMDDEDDELLLGSRSERCAQSYDPAEPPNELLDSEAAEEVEEDLDQDVESADESPPDESDEESSLKRKPPEEQQEIRHEIEDLISCVPELDQEYRIIDRLGTGTFSSVYKAEDLNYHFMDNEPWHGHHPPTSSAYYQSVSHSFVSRVYVAVKRIYVTSNPERIRNEIAILEEARGCRHVSQLITAFRRQDQVVVIMPYQKNVDFRDFYLDLPWHRIRDYFRCLFRALRDVHSRHIIHRDVKPANFLFNPETGIGTLCDFGLANKIDYEYFEKHAYCNHGTPTPEEPHGRQLQADELNTDLIRHMQNDSRKRSLLPSDRVGYPNNDTRLPPKVNRAGTRGFRAPEVLLKCYQQTGAIDIWAAGIILLFYLCGRFPMFRSDDDTEALMEIAAIIGKKSMERVAALHMRTFTTNVPAVTPNGITWKEFSEKQNVDLYTIGPPALEEASSPHSSTSSLIVVGSRDERRNEVNAAFDLLNHLLDVDCSSRWTAQQVLQHPWLSKDETENDNVFFPHPPGQGACADLHFFDSVTGEHVVRVESGIRRLVAGEGLAIGNSPCEFHR